MRSQNRWSVHQIFNLKRLGSSPTLLTYSLCSIVVNVLDCQSRDWGPIPPQTALLSMQSPIYSGIQANGRISLIAKAVVLKTTSNHVTVMCGLESHFFLNWRVNLLGNRDYLLNRLCCKRHVFRLHCSPLNIDVA